MNAHPDLLDSYDYVAERLERACARAGVRRGQLTLLAVSKLHPATDIDCLANHGQLDFGENYVQEALAKRKALESSGHLLRWHMIGHVQTRKAARVAGEFTLVHSLDSMALADALERPLLLSGRTQDVLIEVNIGDEKRKTGIASTELKKVAEHVISACPHLRLRGLMCIPPHSAFAELARPFFARLRSLRDDLEKSCGVRLPHLSMGMSSDFEVAVEEGSTIVRIGTGIFGERPVKK